MQEGIFGSPIQVTLQSRSSQALARPFVRRFQLRRYQPAGWHCDRSQITPAASTEFFPNFHCYKCVAPPRWPNGVDSGDALMFWHGHLKLEAKSTRLESSGWNANFDVPVA